MRRTALLLFGMLLVAACGEAPASDVESEGDPPPPVETEEGHELLFLGMGTGVRVFDTATEGVTLDAEPAVPAQQGNAVYRAIPRAGGTEVAAFDPATGDSRWSTLLPEPMELRIASQDGTAAVLGPVRPDDGSIPGRDTTRLTIVRGADDVRGYDVPANIEPETFSLDTNGLFVVEYLPALAPTQYTVRLLDLQTGELENVVDRWGEDREPMQGTARKHVFSPDGSRLYTYYEIQGDPYVGEGEPFKAFVHVLDLEEEWAYCAELPLPFGTTGATPGLAISPDGADVYVADGMLGQIAEIDTQTVEFTRQASFAPALATVAAVATDDSLFVSADANVYALDRATLTERSSFSAADWIGAMYVSRSGDRIYAAIPDRVEVYDAATYARVGDMLVGKQPVEYFDPSNVPIDATDDVIKCAC